MLAYCSKSLALPYRISIILHSALCIYNCCISTFLHFLILCFRVFAFFFFFFVECQSPNSSVRQIALISEWAYLTAKLSSRVCGMLVIIETAAAISESSFLSRAYLLLHLKCSRGCKWEELSTLFRRMLRLLLTENIGDPCFVLKFVCFCVCKTRLSLFACCFALIMYCLSCFWLLCTVRLLICSNRARVNGDMRWEWLWDCGCIGGYRIIQTPMLGIAVVYDGSYARQYCLE